jgi:hypothetical protein
MFKVKKILVAYEDKNKVQSILECIPNARVSMLFYKFCKRGFEMVNWKQPALEGFS